MAVQPRIRVRLKPLRQRRFVGPASPGIRAAKRIPAGMTHDPPRHHSHPGCRPLHRPRIPPPAAPCPPRHAQRRRTQRRQHDRNRRWTWSRRDDWLGARPRRRLGRDWLDRDHPEGSGRAPRGTPVPPALRAGARPSARRHSRTRVEGARWLGRRAHVRRRGGRDLRSQPPPGPKFRLKARTCSPALRTVRMQRGSPCGSGSTLRRSRPMRMSIERSNGSHSRLRVCISSWSRDSTRFGLARNTRSSSYSIAVIGCSVPSASNRRRDSRSSLAAAEGDAAAVAAGAAGSGGFGRRPRLQPAQHALHPCQQFARVEGLGDVVVGAELQADDAVDDIGRGRDHDDAQVVVLAQVARQTSVRPRRAGAGRAAQRRAARAPGIRASARRCRLRPRRRRGPRGIRAASRAPTDRRRR